MALHNIGTDHAAPSGMGLPLALPRIKGIKLNGWTLLIVALVVIVVVGATVGIRVEAKRQALIAQDTNLFIERTDARFIEFVRARPLSRKEAEEYIRQNYTEDPQASLDNLAALYNSTNTDIMSYEVTLLSNGTYYHSVLSAYTDRAGLRRVY
jgi:hypothetical protein